MLSNQEVANLYRNRGRAPDDERADMQQQLTEHFYDSSKAKEFYDILPKGMAGNSQLLGEIMKAMKVGNRNVANPKGAPYKSALDQPDQAMQAMPGLFRPPVGIPDFLKRQQAKQDPIIRSILQRIRALTSSYTKLVNRGPEAILHGFEGFDIVPTYKPSWEPMNEAEQRKRLEFAQFVLNSGDTPRFTVNGKPNMEDLDRLDMDGSVTQILESRFVLDRLAVELNRTMNRKRLSGYYVLPGETIWRVDQRTWQQSGQQEALRNPHARYAQVYQNQIITTYGSNDIYVSWTNSSSEIGRQFYGTSEVEMCMKMTTGILNVIANNNAIFDRNAIPEVILVLRGMISQASLGEFQDEWESYRNGAAGQYGMPAINIRDPQGGIEAVDLKKNPDEMTFSSYVSFLAALDCAIFGIDISEINLSAFGGKTSGLGGSGKEHESRSLESRNRCFIPWMNGLAKTYNTILQPVLGDDWRFEWIGLQKQDQKQLWDTFTKVATIDETRQMLFNLPPVGDPLVDKSMVNNPSVSQIRLSIEQEKIRKDGAWDEGKPVEKNEEKQPPAKK